MGIKRTRRFKALRFKALNRVNGELPSIVEKIAVYDKDDNMIDCCIINQCDNMYGGREFYFPNNANDDLGLFSKKVKDAYQYIKDGYGDCITKSEFLGITPREVIRFIDREYGESIRQEFLEDWKGVEFDYGIEFSTIDLPSEGRLICKDNNIFTFINKPEDILHFNSNKEAEEYIKEVEDISLSLVNEYNSLHNLCTGDRDKDYEEIYKPFFASKKLNRFSIYWRVFMSYGERNGNQILIGKPKYSLDIIQLVK